MGNTRCPVHSVGIVGYGAYVPRFRLPASEIANLWQGREGPVPIQEKAVPGPDEDTTTMCIESGRNALRRAGISPEQIGAVWVGTESKPYAVKPTATMVAQALGVGPYTQAADIEFACKGGSEAMQAAFGMVGAGMISYAMVFGADTAQARPGDPLEYTAAAGAACLIIGPGEQSLAVLEGSISYVTDTPDFFRRQHQHYPSHGGRFTGDMAYFHHTESSSRRLLEELERRPSDYTHAIFHQPNQKFPQRVAKKLGFSPAQIEHGLLSPKIGNTYAGASLLGLSAVLDQASAGQKIFMATFGSGAGSDAFSFEVRPAIEGKASLAPKTQRYLDRRKVIDYATYARIRKKLHEC